MKLSTKKDFTDLLFDILNPIKSHYSEKNAYLMLGTHSTWYEDAGAKTESFSRPLWGLVPFFAGGGEDEEFEKIYINGITAGTDPNSGEYWGDCHDADQRFVEMAAMAYGIMFAPQKLWEPLSDEAKDNYAAWLYTINDHRVCDSNWTFFRVLVNIALKGAGRKYSAEILEKDLNRIDEFYIGDGWYKDGVKGQKDYYIPFAFHFYSLIYARYMENEDPERSKLYKDRACEFAQQFIYWFDDNGEALPYGRSLTYRFAQTAFWSACVFTGIKPFPVGVMKGIIVRNFRQWFENSQIFDNGHILTVGYKYANLLMAEHYNAPGSPYWSLKVFAMLMLDDNDEFWSAEEEPLPKLADKKLIKAADMLVTRHEGHVTAYVAGTHNEFGCGQIIPKYLKFAYSTKYGFNVMRSSISLDEAAPDNMLVFDIDGMMFVRRKNIAFELHDDSIVTEWSPFIGITVKTTVIPIDGGHKRVHKITSEYDCMAYDCGFAISERDEDECEISYEKAYAKNKFAYCKTESKQSVGGHIIHASPNTNLYYPKTVIPAVKYEIKKGTSEVETFIYNG